MIIDCVYENSVCIALNESVPWTKNVENTGLKDVGGYNLQTSEY